MATTRNTSALAGYKANSVEKFGGFRMEGHLYKAVTYNLSYTFLKVVLTSKSLPELKSVDQFSAYEKIINKYI